MLWVELPYTCVHISFTTVRYLAYSCSEGEQGAVLEGLGRSHLLTRGSLVHHKWCWNHPRLGFLFLMKRVVMLYTQELGDRPRAGRGTARELQGLGSCHREVPP